MESGTCLNLTACGSDAGSLRSSSEPGLCTAFPFLLGVKLDETAEQLFAAGKDRGLGPPLIISLY